MSANFWSFVANTPKGMVGFPVEAETLQQAMLKAPSILAMVAPDATGSPKVLVEKSKWGEGPVCHLDMFAFMPSVKEYIIKMAMMHGRN